MSFRKKLSKAASSRSFKKGARGWHKKNTAVPMRGGIRL